MIPSAPVATAPISLAVALLLGLLMHWWPRLSGPWRRRLSIATSAAGLAFLVAAMRAEGLRESAVTSVVILGPSYHTATASASASLYYYVLTAVCLALGFAGLAFGEGLSALLAAALPRRRGARGVAAHGLALPAREERGPRLARAGGRGDAARPHRRRVPRDRPARRRARAARAPPAPRRLCVPRPGVRRAREHRRHAARHGDALRRLEPDVGAPRPDRRHVRLRAGEPGPDPSG